MSNLITHMRFLCTVSLHVLRQSLLHGVNPVAHRARELGDLGRLGGKQKTMHLKHDRHMADYYKGGIKSHTG